MKMTVKEILTKYEKAKGIKSSWDSKYEEVFDVTMPSRNNVTDSTSDVGYTEKRADLFTSVGEQAADEFVNRMQESVFPIGDSWVNIEAGEMVEDAKKEQIDKELAKLCKIANAYKNKSNFDLSISEFFYDLIAGTSVLAVLENDEDNPFNFIAIPIKDFCISEGKLGEAGITYRKFKMKSEMIKHQWLEVKRVPEEDDGKEKELLEVVYKDYDTGNYVYSVILLSTKTKLVERTSRSNPFIVFRWTKLSDEVYGRGVGMKALRDLKTLNKIMENSLIAQAFTLPMFLAQQDGMLDIDNIEVEPLAMIPVPSTATGNPSITQLQTNTNHDITMYNIENMEMKIRKTMLASSLPAEVKGQMTATEVAQRQADLMVSLGSVYGRLFSELYEPLIKRMFEILIKFGKVDASFDIKDINSLFIRANINTPVSKGQNKKEVMNVVSALQLFQSFDPNLQMLQATTNSIDLSLYVLKEFGVPANLIKTKEEATQIVQGQQEAAAAAEKNAADADAERQMAIDANKEEVKNNG